MFHSLVPYHIIVPSAATPIWNRAATACLKQKILDGVVPTNPAKLTNKYICGTLSATIFPDYHLTGANGHASVIRQFRTAFDSIQLENQLSGARRGKTHFLVSFSLSEYAFTNVSSSSFVFSLSPVGAEAEEEDNDKDEDNDDLYNSYDQEEE